MPAFHSRLFTRSDLPGLLRLVTDNARARWPGAAQLLNSDVAWRLPGSRGDLRLWYDDDVVAGYAWFSLTTASDFDLRSDVGYDSPISADLLRWLEARRREFKPLVPWLIPLESMQEWEQALDDGLPLAEGKDTILQLGAFDSDADRIDLLKANGFTATEHFCFHMRRSLDTPISKSTLTDGWRVRHVLPDDFDARVAVHRDSWHRSTFTREQYLLVRAINVFDPELDLVAESPDGEFASYCIGWVDAASGVGSFEPVGTPPAWRRRGLGREVQYEGLRRMKAKGMHSARIGTAGFNDRAFGLYSSCGFELVDRERTYVKVL